jgi:hypothetical protein
MTDLDNDYTTNNFMHYKHINDAFISTETVSVAKLTEQVKITLNYTEN